MRSRLDQLNPLTLVAAALLLVTLAFAGPQPWSAALSLGVALLLAVVAAPALGLRVVTMALSAGAPTFVLLLIVNGAIAREPDAESVASGFALRLAASVAALGAVVAGVDPRRLTRAMAQRGLPAWASYVMVASLEAVPRARQHARDVMDAQRCRGLSTGGGLIGRLRALAFLAGPLVVSLVTESEERARSLDARAFDPRARRTAMTAIADPQRERILRAALWLVIASLFVWKIATES
ncbi:MAG: energy-coupling factor transporter transmembrane component T [Gemmatimonadaceae bacterium]